MNRTARTAGPAALALTAITLAGGLFLASAPAATATTAPAATPTATVFALGQ